jgi:hypothetical protein
VLALPPSWPVERACGDLSIRSRGQEAGEARADLPMPRATTTEVVPVPHATALASVGSCARLPSASRVRHCPFNVKLAVNASPAVNAPPAQLLSCPSHPGRMEL